MRRRTAIPDLRTMIADGLLQTLCHHDPPPLRRDRNRRPVANGQTMTSVGTFAGKVHTARDPPGEALLIGGSMPTRHANTVGIPPACNARPLALATATSTDTHFRVIVSQVASGSMHRHRSDARRPLGLLTGSARHPFCGKLEGRRKNARHWPKDTI